jgi:hypothetical protein
MLGAEVPNCSGVAFIRAPILPAQGARGAMVRSKRLARRTLNRLRGRSVRAARPKLSLPQGRPPDLLGAMRRVLARARLAVMFGEGEPTFNARTQKVLRGMRASLPEGDRSRMEVVVVPGRTLAGFESIETQDALIAEVVRFASAAMGGTPSQLRTA